MGVGGWGGGIAQEQNPWEMAEIIAQNVKMMSKFTSPVKFTYFAQPLLGLLKLRGCNCNRAIGIG